VPTISFGMVLCSVPHCSCLFSGTKVPCQATTDPAVSLQKLSLPYMLKLMHVHIESLEPYKGDDWGMKTVIPREGGPSGGGGPLARPRGRHSVIENGDDVDPQPPENGPIEDQDARSKRGLSNRARENSVRNTSRGPAVVQVWWKNSEGWRAVENSGTRNFVWRVGFWGRISPACIGPGRKQVLPERT